MMANMHVFMAVLGVIFFPDSLLLILATNGTTDEQR